MTKYTLGVMPRFIWLEKRAHALGTAIMDRIEAWQHVPPEWLEEYNQIQEELVTNHGTMSSVQ